MKIVLTRSMLPGDIQYIRDGLDREIAGQYTVVVPEEFTESGICAVADDADVFLGPYVTRTIMEKARSLRLIQVPWTGMDTFDFSAVRGFSVPVCNTHSNADSVAEMCLAIVLDLLKKTAYHDRKMRAGSWNRDQSPLNLKSRMLSRQTVCVLGFGNIGSRVGKLIAAFGAKLVAVGGASRASDVAAEVYTHDRILEAVENADLVICTLPLTEETRNLINADFFRAMKDGAVLVNMSRAPIIAEDALWDALVSGKLGAFGSDVWWNAPKRGESQSFPSARHPFWELENVLMSPHRAGFVEGCLPHLDGAIENIIALEKGRPLAGMIDIGKGY